MAENQKKEKQNGQKENHTCLPVPDSQRLPNADIAAAYAAATGGRRRARASTALVTRTVTPSQAGRRQWVRLASESGWPPSDSESGWPATIQVAQGAASCTRDASASGFGVRIRRVRSPNCRCTQAPANNLNAFMIIRLPLATSQQYDWRWRLSRFESNIHNWTDSCAYAPSTVNLKEPKPSPWSTVGTPTTRD